MMKKILLYAAAAFSVCAAIAWDNGPNITFQTGTAKAYVWTNQGTRVISPRCAIIRYIGSSPVTFGFYYQPSGGVRYELGRVTATNTMPRVYSLGSTVALSKNDMLVVSNNSSATTTNMVVVFTDMEGQQP